VTTLEGKLAETYRTVQAFVSLAVLSRNQPASGAWKQSGEHSPGCFHAPLAGGYVAEAWHRFCDNTRVSSTSGRRRTPRNQRVRQGTRRRRGSRAM